MRPAKVLHKAEIAKCPGGGWGVSREVIGDGGEECSGSGNYAPEGVHLRP